MFLFAVRLFRRITEDKEAHMAKSTENTIRTDSASLRSHTSAVRSYTTLEKAGGWGKKLQGIKRN